MFYYSPSKKNKHQKNTNMPFQDYIYTASGRSNADSGDLSGDLEVELLSNIYDMRQVFRQRAKKMRNLYSGRGMHGPTI